MDVVILVFVLKRHVHFRHENGQFDFIALEMVDRRIR